MFYFIHRGLSRLVVIENPFMVVSVFFFSFEHTQALLLFYFDVITLLNAVFATTPHTHTHLGVPYLPSFTPFPNLIIHI